MFNTDYLYDGVEPSVSVYQWPPLDPPESFPELFPEYFTEPTSQTVPVIKKRQLTGSQGREHQQNGTAPFKKARIAEQESPDSSTLYKIQDIILTPKSSDQRSPFPIVTQRTYAKVEVVFETLLALSSKNIIATFDKVREVDGTLKCKEISNNRKIIEKEVPPHVEIDKGKVIVTYHFKLKEGTSSHKNKTVYHLSFVINGIKIRILDHIIVTSHTKMKNNLEQGGTLNSRLISLVSGSSWYQDYLKNKKNVKVKGAPHSIGTKTADDVDEEKGKDKPEALSNHMRGIDEINFNAILEQLIEQKKQELVRLENLRKFPNQNEVIALLLQEYSKED